MSANFTDIGFAGPTSGITEAQINQMLAEYHSFQTLSANILNRLTAVETLAAQTKTRVDNLTTLVNGNIGDIATLAGQVNNLMPRVTALENKITTAGILPVTISAMLKDATMDVQIPLIVTMPSNVYTQRVFLTNQSAASLLGSIAIADDQKAKTINTLTVTLKNIGAVPITGSLVVVAIVEK